MNKSRGKKAVKNTIASLIAEFTALICGLILPKLILSAFGSSYNGMISSITQFLSCIALLQVGVGSVTQVALYKPLADKDNLKISGILNATEHFMRKIALIFVALIVLLAVVYSWYISNEFAWIETFSLVLILGISTFAQYYFGITYQQLLTADQRQSVIYTIQIIATVLNTLIAAILILSDFSIHIVKLGSAVAFSLSPVLTYLYVKKNYTLIKGVKPDDSAIKQRWDAFAHEITNFINSNTDIIILTLFTGFKEISVYTVYYMIINNLSKLLKNTLGGIRAAFGNMFAKNEKIAIERNLRLLELYIFTMSNILFIVSAIMIVPFITVYTKGITDVEYERLAFASIAILAAYFGCIRLTYVNIVQALGHFKQTKKGAYIEAIINIVISLILASQFGLIGVSIGTLCAAVFRTVQYERYMSKYIIKRSISVFLKHILSAVISLFLVLLINNFIDINSDLTYLSWSYKAIVITIITCVVVLLNQVILFKKESRIFFAKIYKNIFILKFKKIK